jgi:hypothetical protein
LHHFINCAPDERCFPNARITIDNTDIGITRDLYRAKGFHQQIELLIAAVQI